MKVLILSAISILAFSLFGCASEPGPSAPTPSAPVADATPTVEEALREFTLCESLRANKSLSWGQAPGTIYSGDPATSGEIEQGDSVRFLTQPNADGKIRVEVYPNDNRAVGKTENKVWIDWTELTRYRSDQLMFTCEE